MSLLNKVLRDLEHRRAGDETASPGVTGVKAVAAPAGRRRSMVLLGVCALVAVAVAAVTHELPGFWRLPSERGPRVIPMEKPAEPKVVVTPNGASADDPIVSMPVPAAAESALPQEKVAPETTLLRALRIAEEIETPIKSDSEHPPVAASVAPPLSPTTGAQAVRVVDNALQLESRPKAEPTSQTPGAVSLPAKGARAGHSSVAMAANSLPHANEVSVGARSPSLPATGQSTARSLASSSDVSVAAIEKNVREPDAGQRAAQAVETGLQSMARKQYAEAQRAFHAALALDPRNDRARQALLSALLAMDDRQAAEPIADEGMLQGVAKVGFALVSARLKLERGAVKEALAVLERERAAGAAHADYLALWGNALSREARYGEAAQMYAAAVERAPVNPAHHIGLGYALRNDGQFASAYAVFQSVAEMPGLSPQLADLVEQQLGSLQRLIVKR